MFENFYKVKLECENDVQVWFYWFDNCLENLNELGFW